LCVAGLYHSIYGTPAYPDGPLPKSRRGELSNVIGVQAEEIVHQFSDMNWPLIFANGHDVLKTLPVSLLTLAAANIVEQGGRLARTNPGDGSIQESLECFELLIPYLTPTAAGCLAAELQHMRDEF
jgi:hypothetical protein